MSQAEDTARRENRFHVALSDGELRAIDDYRFELRIATRAEAVRRLITLGLPKMEEQAMFARLNAAAQRQDDERLNAPQPERHAGESQ